MDEGGAEGETAVLMLGDNENGKILFFFFLRPVIQILLFLPFLRFEN